MRKYFIILFSLFFVLFSCTKTEVIDLSKKQEIGFKVINSIQTKTNTTLAGNVKLGVFAHFSNGTPYFGNSIFEQSQADPTKTTWVGNPPKYWPGTSSLNFKVYAPYQETGVSEKKVVGMTDDIKFLRVENVKADNDFLYGTDIFSFSKDANTFAVPLKHAEAFLCFKVKCLGGKLTIQQITVHAEPTGDIEIDYSTQGKPSISWTPTGDTEQGRTIRNSETNKQTPITEEGQYIGKTATDGILVIPREQTSLTINYTLDGQSTTVNVPLDVKDNAGNVPQWEAGKKYIYTITFNFSEISFEAEEGNWEKNPGEDINQDIG